MLCAKLILCLILLVCVFQSFCFAEEPISRLHARGSPRPSDSKSPSHSGSGGHQSPPRTIRLFGVDISQPPKRPASPAHPSQTTHSHSPHTSASTHAAGSTPTRGGTLKLNHPKTLVKPRPKPSKEYAEWVSNLHGPIAKKLPGPTIKPPAERKPRKFGPKTKPRAPAGTSKRYESDKRYQERKKLKKLAEQAGNHPSGHNEHPSREGRGGNGGGSPGSPGAGTHAVSKRRIGANRGSDVPQG